MVLQRAWGDASKVRGRGVGKQRRDARGSPIHRPCAVRAFAHRGVQSRHYHLHCNISVGQRDRIEVVSYVKRAHGKGFQT